MKKHVVIFSAFLSPYRSGAEACVEEVSKRLIHEYDITIVTSRMSRTLPKRDMLDGLVPVVRVGFGMKWDPWLFPFLAPFAARTITPDVVHAVLETFAGLALSFSRFLLPSAKRLLTLQTTNRSFLKSHIIRAADRVTAISTALVERARQSNVEAVRIPNGIDLVAINAACARYEKVSGRILFVGRLEPMKGIDTLLQACGALDAEYHLRIAGDGSEKEKLVDMADSLSISHKVTFLGRVDPAFVAEEYAQAQIFCGLSRSEALGNVFLEAEAAGCAILGTTVGGIPDSVDDGVTGFLIAPDDVDQASVKLLQLLQNPGLCQRMGAAGKKKVQGYDWDDIAKKYQLQYEQFS